MADDVVVPPVGPAEGDGGVDVKWTPNADTAIDGTVNPDFSQIESDSAVISTNQRFAIFLPEKRPFFLEGADILQSPLQVLYTRSVADPSWGLRATQRAERFDGTVMVTRDDGGGTVLLPNPYGTGYALQDFKSVATFARGRWQIDGASVGALFADLREGLDNTVVVARRCAYMPAARQPILPAFPVSPGLTEADELRRQANEWSVTRGARSGRVAWQFIQDLAGRLGQRLE